MLVTAITQSLRSVLFTLIPAGIITFLAWAIAGSAYASTSDPFRAATWIFLGSHAIPFNLQIPPSGAAGWLTYLPLGAMALPAIGIAIGAKRTLSKTSNELSVWIFASSYLVIVVALSWLSSNKDVYVHWYWAIAFATPFIFLVSLFSINQFRFSAPLVYLAKIWSLLLGFAAILLGISLIINLRTVQQLTTVLQPGIVGGVLLLALTVLYLPNFIIATLAYISGAGFALGRDTLIAPLTFELGKIPALPILGALPTGRHPMYLAFALAIVIVGGLAAYWTLDSGRLVLRQVIALFVISSFVISYLGSGALITYELGSVGPSLWKFPLILSAEFLLGVGTIKLLPMLMDQLSQLGRK